VAVDEDGTAGEVGGGDSGAIVERAALELLHLGPAGGSAEPSPPPGEEDNQPPPGEIERCDDAVRAQVEQFQGRTLDDRSAVAAADLAGRPILVYSHPVLDDPGAADQLTVADAGTCQILAVVQR
jgi:hypothetical protein